MNVSLPNTPPLNPPVNTSALNPEQATNSAAQRLGEWISIIGQKLYSRLERATRAFHNRIEWELTPAPALPANDSDRRIRLAGFLFPLQGGQPLPLLEGCLLYETENEGLSILLPASEERPEKETWKVEGGELQVRTGKGEVKRFETNESLLFGTHHYLVKLFDSSARIEKTMPLNKGAAGQGEGK